MNPSIELLRIEFLGVTVRHEEVPLDGAELALHFVDIGERHGLSRMDLADGGAVFSGADGAELAIRPGQIGSCGVTNLGYREGAERIVGALEETVTRFGVGRMWAEDITLVAVWDLGDPELARSLLVDDILRVDEQRLELLGEAQAIQVARPFWLAACQALLELVESGGGAGPGPTGLPAMSSRTRS